MTTSARIAPGLQRGLWIGGRPDSSARTFEVRDPATSEVIAVVSDGTADDAVRAVDAAATAFPAWAETAPRERAEVLRRCYDMMVAATDRLVALICGENGKSAADARAEIGYAAEFFRWFGEEAVRTAGSYSESPAGGARTIVSQTPVGVAALVTPWNFPAAMATRKIAPALAAGCTVVLKPAVETPLTALAVAQVLSEAGIPDGVVNVVPTTDPASIVGTWLTDVRVRKISFTGSTGVGRMLLRQAADRVLNASMELGGNAPFIVTADADLDAAVAGAMVAKFRGGGQACTAANRFYVHRDVVADFTGRFGALVEQLAVGPASDPATQVGPLISERAVEDVRRLVDRAVAAGARVSHRAPIPDYGWFYPPTVLSAVPADAAILGEEIFGPVAPIVAWDDEEDLLRRVNATPYGLAAYVYAGRLQDALRLADRIEAGMIGINRGIVSDPAAPFGGVKESGLGREGAREGIREYQETRYISVDWPM